MKERNKAVPAVYLLLIRKHEILMTRRFQTGYFDGFYSVPAGHVEAGELPRICLVREAREEIGISVKKKDLVLVHTQYRTKLDETGDRANYFFETKTWKGKPLNMEPHKCSEIRWFDLNELPKKITPEVRKALSNYRKKIIYSELPFNIKDINPTK